MPDRIRIRVEEQADLSHVTNLYGHLNPGDTLPPADVARDVWTRIQQYAGLLILLGEIDGRAVTTCSLVIVPNLTRGGRSYAVIENVVTHPDFRKQGLGTAILAEAVRRAREADCYKVVLTTGSKRESTLSFYEKAGFSRNSRTAFELRF